MNCALTALMVVAKEQESEQALLAERARRGVTRTKRNGGDPTNRHEMSTTSTPAE